MEMQPSKCLEQKNVSSKETQRRDRRLKLKAVREAKISDAAKKRKKCCTCARMEKPLLLRPVMQFRTLFAGWTEK